MNYKKHYDLLIERSKIRQSIGYVEIHHVIPKCIGGTNDKSNLVKLTPEEHYLAHQLLVKIYPGNDRLVYAVNNMTVSSKHTKRNNKLYGWLKRKYQSVCKKRIGEKNQSYGRSWYYNPDTLENGKFLLKDVPSGWIKGRVPKNKCRLCGKSISKKAKLCQNHRHRHRHQIVFRAKKLKNNFSDEDKMQSLITNKGNIRRALLSLGLNDSGFHYRKMRELKAAIYPLPTKQ